MTEREEKRILSEEKEQKEHEKMHKGENEGEEDLDIEGILNQEEDTTMQVQMLGGVTVIDKKGEECTLAETFDAMKLNPNILRGVYGIGFEKPSPIQMTAILPLMNGRDLRAQAQSGTGKTAAFGIAALQKVDVGLKDIQVLIIETTRELAIQTSSVIKKLAAHTQIKVEAVYGGINLAETMDKINSRPHVLVCTPGRLVHLMDLCKIGFNNLKLFILDEADEMLKKGFLETINLIYTKIKSSTIQVGLFSATWGKAEQEISEQILNEPVIISLKNEDQTLKGIKQYYIDVGDKKGASADMSKFEILCDIYSRGKIAQSVIFCNKVERAALLQKNLTDKGFECDLFHSELPQETRNDVMKRFSDGRCRTLVSSGLLARGVDVQTLSVVINFDVPHEKEIDNYIHRIGRAGRFGRKGTAINMVSSEDREMIKRYEDHYNTSIMAMPSDVVDIIE